MTMTILTRKIANNVDNYDDHIYNYDDDRHSACAWEVPQLDLQVSFRNLYPQTSSLSLDLSMNSKKLYQLKTQTQNIK